jgi:small subunit ribosomal protein S20
MANNKAAEKRILTTERNRVRNKSAKSAIRTAIKRVHEAVAQKSADMQTVLATAYSRLDGAVLKGIVHKNTAARYKSRLTAAVNTAQSA